MEGGGQQETVLVTETYHRVSQFALDGIAFVVSVIFAGTV
jgi:hypothetical protein